MTTGIIGSHRRLFIAGTDTGIGKTYFACRLIRFLARSGKNVGVMKPIETGIVAGRTSDGERLKKAAGTDLPIGAISPYRFRTPASPRAAALRERKRIDVGKIVGQFNRLAASHDWLIVEGAGGLLVPILRKFDMADLIRSLRIPLILVCSERLGTINQTLLSVHLSKSRKLNLLGIVVNPGRTKSGEPEFLQNARILRENCELPVIGLPRQSEAGKEETFWRALLGRDS